MGQHWLLFFVAHAVFPALKKINMAGIMSPSHHEIVWWSELLNVMGSEKTGTIKFSCSTLNFDGFQANTIQRQQEPWALLLVCILSCSSTKCDSVAVLQSEVLWCSKLGYKWPILTSYNTRNHRPHSESVHNITQ